MKLKLIRTQKKYSQQQLANKIGVSRSTVAMWETNSSQPDNDMLKKLSSVLDCSVDQLLGIETIGKYKIPVYGAVAAGIPIEAIENIVDWEEIDEATFKKGVIALRIKGRSMEPRICEGDVVIVQKQTYIDDGQIAIVMVNGNDATCKKIKHSHVGMTLISLNPAYEPIFYSREDVINLPVKIIGKVIELRGKF